jgi:hypothetical protein
MNTYSEINKSGDVFLSTIEINQDSIDTNKIDDLKKRIIDTKKRVIREVEKLNKLEHMEIFKILRSHNVIYSENVNGIFINLSPVNIGALNDIILFINYVKNKNIELLEKESTLQKTKEEIFGTSDNSINNLDSKIKMLKSNLKNSLETFKN